MTSDSMKQNFKGFIFKYRIAEKSVQITPKISSKIRPSLQNIKVFLAQMAKDYHKSGFQKNSLALQ